MARRFKAQESTTQKELISVMRHMDANNLKVNKDLLQGDVEIVFDRGPKRYVFRCNKYDNSADNYRAAQLCISYLYRALEAYGVTKDEESLFDQVFENFFLGFEATPDDTVLMLENKTEWYEILGVNPNATKREIKQAFRVLSKFHHPDTGGSAESFQRLNEAYQEAMRSVQ